MTTNIDEIQKTVAIHYNIKVSDLKSSRKLKIYALPRQICMYLSRTLTKSSYPEIGAKFGGKDHSTVIHAFRHVEKKMTEEKKKKKALETLINELQK